MQEDTGSAAAALSLEHAWRAALQHDASEADPLNHNTELREKTRIPPSYHTPLPPSYHTPLPPSGLPELDTRWYSTVQPSPCAILFESSHCMWILARGGGIVNAVAVYTVICQTKKGQPY